MTRSAFVTGASTGIGLQLARKLAQRGWQVFAGVLPGSDTAGLTAGVALTVIDQDVTNEPQVQSGAQEVGRVLAGAGLDLLINNAGIADVASGPLEGVDLAQAQRLFDVNVFGQIRVSKAFLPLLHQSTHSPRIVNIASGAVRVPTPCAAIYNMSKYAVEGLTNTLRYELAPFGIQVTSIEPGAVRTHMTRDPVDLTWGIWERASPAIRARYADKLRAATDVLCKLLQSAGSADEVTDEVLRVVELAKLRSRYVAGRDVRMLPLLQALLTESAFERLIAKQFKI